MGFEQVLEIANALMSTKFGRHLNDVETAILIGAWKNQTYEQIAEHAGYSISYLTRDVGPKLWKSLSQALGENVSKTNFQTALERSYRKETADNRQPPDHKKQQSPDHQQEASTSPQASLLTSFATQSPLFSPQPVASASRCDWGEATDVSLFYGRAEELHTLKQWILPNAGENTREKQGQRCRLVILLGMGGIGKTSLTVKLAQDIQPHFDCVIWRSLRNAPPLKTLLSDLVAFVSNQQDTAAELGRLTYWMRSHRCLVVLDNMETLLQAGDRAGYYRPGYEDYGDLLRAVGETVHQSCLLLTSREKPAALAALEGMEFAVRSLQLKGSLEATQALICAKGLVGTAQKQQQLCELYGCNPLALKIVSTSIQDLFDGDIEAFLEQDAAVFSGVHRLLDQQCERCSRLEKTIMYWLAINREWTSIAELAADIVPAVSRADLLETLESLSWRSLIEKQSGRYTQQPVVMEYTTSRLIDQACREILHQFADGATASTALLQSHALLKAQGKDYIKDTQIGQLLKPILEQLTTTLSNRKNVESQLSQLLTQLRQDAPLEPGYAAGNLFNLLRQLQVDFTGYDFSHLTLWQADLRDMQLHHVNFSNVDLARSIFTETLSIPFAVAFSPDGKVLATGDVDGKVRLWQVSDGKNLLTCKGHTSWVWSVAFSPDGQFLASSSDDKTIKLWDLQTGDCYQTLQGHTHQVWSVAFSADGQTIASGSEDHTVKLWNLVTGQCLKTLEGHQDWVRSVAFSPDGQLLASGSDDHTVKVWNTQTGACRTLTGHAQRVWSIAFDPNGKQLISGSSDHTVKIWHPDTGNCLNTLHGHANWVRSVAFSPDGQTIASGSEDQTIRVWDSITGQCQQTLRGHTNWVRSVAFSPDGHTLASGSGDHTVKLWDVATGYCRKTLQGYTNRILAVAFSPDGRTLASGYDDHAIRLWDIEQLQCSHTLRGHTKAVCCVNFSPQGRLLASSSSDQTIRIWDLTTGHCSRTLQGHASRVWSVAFSADGQFLISGSDDQTVKVWELQTGQCVQTLQGHSNWVCSVAFCPALTDQLTNQLTNQLTDQLTNQLTPDQTKAPTSRNSPSLNGLAISGSYDQTLKLWQLSTGECLHTLSGDSHWVWSVAASPDGQRVASGGGDHTVKLWNMETGECDRTLQGHSSRIWSVEFDPTGKILASASSDHTIKLWTVDTGECDRTLQGHKNLVWSVAFSPTGTTLASGSQDETIKLWTVNTGECVATLKADRPYEYLNISGIRGLTESQIASLKLLGAIEGSAIEG